MATKKKTAKKTAAKTVAKTVAKEEEAVAETKEPEPVVEENASAENSAPEPEAAPEPEIQPAQSTKIQTMEHNKTVIVFVSKRDDEPTGWEIMGIRGARNSSTGRIEWHVSIKDAAKFEKHHFVQTGRVVKV